MEKIFRLACIDPDTVCAGLAIFESNTDERTIKILCTHTIRPTKSAPWEVRSKLIAADIMGVCVALGVDGIVLEMPMIYQSAKGVAASNSGSMEKLLFATGAIYAAVTLQLQSSAECELINPSRWKGNVPKSVTATRVLRHWGFQNSNSDVTDAVGIGDWYFRKYKRSIYHNYRIIKQ